MNHSQYMNFKKLFLGDSRISRIFKKGKCITIYPNQAFSFLHLNILGTILEERAAKRAKEAGCCDYDFGISNSRIVKTEFGTLQFAGANYFNNKVFEVHYMIVEG